MATSPTGCNATVPFVLVCMILVPQNNVWFTSSFTLYCWVLFGSGFFVMGTDSPENQQGSDLG